MTFRRNREKKEQKKSETKSTDEKAITTEITHNRRGKREDSSGLKTNQNKKLKIKKVHTRSEICLRNKKSF